MVELNLEEAPIFAELSLNPKQGEFVIDRTPFLLGSGGKGGGKTVGLGAKTIALLTNSELYGNMAGNVGCIGRLHEKDLRNTTLRELWNWLPRSWVRKENKDEGFIELINESVLFTMHYDNLDHITSFNIGFAAIDQLEEIPLEVFDELAYSRIRLKVMRRYVEGSNPKILVKPKFADVEPFECISTDPEELATVLRVQTVFGCANPRQSALYRKFVRNEEYRKSADPEIQAQYNPDYKIIEIPTYENQKWLPTGYIARQKRDKTDRQFKRDVLGQSDAYEGIIYADFSDDLILGHNIIPSLNWKLYIGIDHGGSGDTNAGRTINVTGVTFIAVEERSGDYDMVYVVDELYRAGSTIEETVAAIDNKLQAIQTAVLTNIGLTRIP